MSRYSWVYFIVTLYYDCGCLIIKIFQIDFNILR